MNNYTLTVANLSIHSSGAPSEAKPISCTRNDESQITESRRRPEAKRGLRLELHSENSSLFFSLITVVFSLLRQIALRLRSIPFAGTTKLGKHKFLERDHALC